MSHSWGPEDITFGNEFEAPPSQFGQSDAFKSRDYSEPDFMPEQRKPEE